LNESNNVLKKVADRMQVHLQKIVDTMLISLSSKVKNYVTSRGRTEPLKLSASRQKRNETFLEIVWNGRNESYWAMMERQITIPYVSREVHQQA
jgi:hypothetical protein